MKMAIVFDDLIQYGGAERLLLSIHEIWPEAPIYTSVASKKWLKLCKRENITVKTSFMQRLPFVEKLNRFYSVLFFHMLAFESFNLKDFDLVLSVSARYAHMIITKPQTVHICYMNSPGRMFWDYHSYFENESKGRLKNLSAFFTSYIRLSDFVSSKRVDFFLANSNSVKDKIKRYYDRDSLVVFPFIDNGYSENIRSSKGGYYVVVSRLVAWKHIDIAIEACMRANLPLKIIGQGPDLKRLQSISNSCIEFLGPLSDKEKYSCISGAIALIHPQKEDFGLTILEAMSCGKPVIAYGKGGALDTVVPSKTGEFFYTQTADALFEVIHTFKPESYSEHDCRLRALSFDKSIFVRNLRKVITSFN